MNRRDFNKLAAAGLLTPDFAFAFPRGGASASGGSPAPPGSLPALLLTPSQTNSNGPWTFGHAFKQGDLPAGNYISATVGGSPISIQADIRNRWPDGSAKYALLSGIANLTANTAVAVQLAGTATSPSGTNVVEPSFGAGLVYVTLSPGTGTYPIGSTLTLDLSSVLGVDKSTWSNYSAGGRVRSVPGIVMSEFHYFQPTGFGQLCLWWYLRVYSTGAIEVEAVMENGWWTDPSPGEQDYNWSLTTANGTTSFSNILHYAHTRWGYVMWHGNGAPVVPAHNTAYIRSTKQVPNYGWLAPAQSSLTGFNQQSTLPAPFVTSTVSGGTSYGDIAFAIGSGGEHDWIGVLTRWDALYCTSVDNTGYSAAARTAIYNTVIGNARQAGGFDQHFRDQTTGRIPLYTSYSNYSVYTGSGPNEPPGILNGNWNTPGGAPPPWEGSEGLTHRPGEGILAYLIEGRWSQLEQIQFGAWIAIQDSHPLTGATFGTLSPIRAFTTTRGAAWAFRDAGAAASISPTSLGGASPSAADSAVRNSFVNTVSYTASYAKGIYIDGTATLLNANPASNAIGWIGQYDGYSNHAQATTNGTTTIAVTGGNPISLGMASGQTVYGTNIPSGATIVSVTSSSITISSAATGSGAITLYWIMNPSTFWGGSWMVGFQGHSLGYVADQQIEGLAPADYANLIAVRNFVWQNSLQVLQGNTTEYNVTWPFRRGGLYDRPYLSNSTSSDGNPQDAPIFMASSQGGLGGPYGAYVSGYGAPALSTANQGDSLRAPLDYGDIDIPANSPSAYGFGSQGYWAIHGSIAQMAKEAGIAKADKRLALITSAPNYNPQAQGASDSPQFSVAARTFIPPSWYTNVAHGNWGTIPGSELQGSAAQLYGSLPVIGGVTQWNTLNKNVVEPWSSGFLNTVGICDRSTGTGQWIAGTFYCLWGGGHTDYSGNEMYCFGPLESSSPQWYCPRAATNPPYIWSSPGSITSAQAFDSNGNPIGRHTYDSLVYLPNQNWMLALGAYGQTNNGDGNPANTRFNFNLTNPDINQPWGKLADVPFPFPSNGGGTTAVYDPVYDLVWYGNWGGAFGVCYFKPGTNTWSSIGTSSGAVGGGSPEDTLTSTIDTKRGIWAIWNGLTGKVVFYEVYNGGFSANGYYVPTISGTGPPAGGTSPVPNNGSILWDANNDYFVVWSNSGASFWTLSPPASGSPYNGATWTWNEVTPVGGVTPSVECGLETGESSTGTPGTYKRFLYGCNPNMPMYLLLNRVTDQIYFYRP